MQAVLAEAALAAVDIAVASEQLGSPAAPPLPVSPAPAAVVAVSTAAAESERIQREQAVAVAAAAAAVAPGMLLSARQQPTQVQQLIAMGADAGMSGPVDVEPAAADERDGSDTAAAAASGQLQAGLTASQQQAAAGASSQQVPAAAAVQQTPSSSQRVGGSDSSPAADKVAVRDCSDIHMGSMPILLMRTLKEPLLGAEVYACLNPQVVPEPANKTTVLAEVPAILPGHGIEQRLYWVRDYEGAPLVGGDLYGQAYVRRVGDNQLDLAECQFRAAAVAAEARRLAQQLPEAPAGDRYVATEETWLDGVRRELGPVAGADGLSIKVAVEEPDKEPDEEPMRYNLRIVQQRKDRLNRHVDMADEAPQKQYVTALWHSAEEDMQVTAALEEGYERACWAEMQQLPTCHVVQLRIDRLSAGPVSTQRMHQMVGNKKLSLVAGKPFSCLRRWAVGE